MCVYFEFTLLSSAWWTVMFCNDVSRWLGTKLESALKYNHMSAGPSLPRQEWWRFKIHNSCRKYTLDGVCRPGGQHWNIYRRWIGPLRFIWAPVNLIWGCPAPSNGLRRLAYDKNVAVVVPAMAAGRRTPSTESCVMYPIIACACCSPLGGPHASSQIWP